MIKSFFGTWLNQWQHTRKCIRNIGDKSFVLYIYIKEKKIVYYFLFNTTRDNKLSAHQQCTESTSVKKSAIFFVHLMHAIMLSLVLPSHIKSVSKPKFPSFLRIWAFCAINISV